MLNEESKNGFVFECSWFSHSRVAPSLSPSRFCRIVLQQLAGPTLQICGQQREVVLAVLYSCVLRLGLRKLNAQRVPGRWNVSINTSER